MFHDKSSVSRYFIIFLKKTKVCPSNCSKGNLQFKEKNDYAKAAPLLVESLEGRRVKLGDTHPHTLESWNNLIKLYEAWGKPEKAEEWRAKLPPDEDVDE